MEEEKDGRREAAIASTPCLRSDFIPNNTKLTHSHLHKFQELHRRRLQLKAKPKTKKILKGKDHVIKEMENKDTTSKSIENSGVSNSIDNSVKNSSLHLHEIPKELAPKKQRKLHWGLDTKERWERKSNM